MKEFTAYDLNEDPTLNNVIKCDNFQIIKRKPVGTQGYDGSDRSHSRETDVVEGCTFKAVKMQWEHSNGLCPVCHYEHSFFRKRREAKELLERLAHGN